MAIGATANLARLASDATRVVDLQGKTVLPGFYENHNHVSSGNLDPRVQNWRDIASREDLLTAISERAAELPVGEWIIGTLRNENMPQHKLPTRWEIPSLIL